MSLQTVNSYSFRCYSTLYKVYLIQLFFRGTDLASYQSQDTARYLLHIFFYSFIYFPELLMGHKYEFTFIEFSILTFLALLPFDNFPQNRDAQHIARNDSDSYGRNSLFLCFRTNQIRTIEYDGHVLTNCTILNDNDHDKLECAENYQRLRFPVIKITKKNCFQVLVCTLVIKKEFSFKNGKNNFFSIIFLFLKSSILFCFFYS